MYGQSDNSVMPDYSDYDLWDQYMGQLWQGLIENAAIRPDSIIVEVAPGATVKIAQGLSRVGFSGKLYIIEPHVEACRIASEKSRTLLPDAEIISISQDLNAAVINDAIDAVLANHIFDDLISAYAAPNSACRDILFQDISRENTLVLDVLADTWHELIKDEKMLDGVKFRIKEDWRDFIRRHDPRAVILSQYASSYFDKNGLSVINAHAKDLFQMIKSLCGSRKPDSEIQGILDKNENYQNVWIGTELLDAGNWVIDERRVDS